MVVSHPVHHRGMFVRRLAIGAIVAVVLLAFVFGRARGFRVVRLPQPTGASAIGTVLVPVAIASGRTTTLQAWYPASAGVGERAPYAMGLTLPLRLRFVDALAKTEAYVNAPLAPKRWPVVFYVPGLGGNRATNTTLAQDLASNGYVVFAMDDTQPQFVGFDFSTANAVRRSMLAGERKVRLQSDDVSAALSSIERLDGERGGRFAGKLDLAHVGFLGFSFGGAVGAESAVRDARITAVVNLDGWNLGRAMREGVARPQLVMLSKPLVDATDAARIGSPIDRQSFDRKIGASISTGVHRHGGYVAEVDGFGHNDFTDAFLLPSLRHRGGGTIEPARAYWIVERYVRAFLDHYLKDDRSSLLDARIATERGVRLRHFRSSPHSVH